MPDAKRESMPELKPDAMPKAKPEPSPELKPDPVPEAKPEPSPELKPNPVPEAKPEPVPELKPEPAPAPTPIELEADLEADLEANLEASLDEDTPAWDRDPTLAELRPDLEALERAMAVAQGLDPDAEEQQEEVVAPPPKEEPQKTGLEGVPEITLDDSINRKVDAAELERRKRIEEETGILEEEVDPEIEAAAENEKRRKADAELEQIAAGLAQAKTLEDVDDKMAETLFGEELSIAAAAVVAKVAEEKQTGGGAAAEATGGVAANPSGANPDSDDSAEPSALDKEFEEVWGETPNLEVSIESQFEQKQGGLDISASQRLATVRALNSENPATGGTSKTSSNPDEAAAKPEPIEEQITTSMTQTLKALNVRPDPEPINDDDDDDDDDNRKTGFFSRFRRT